MSSVIEMNDEYEVRHVLGMKIVRNCPKKLLGICQEAYIKRVVELFWMRYSKIVGVPIERSLTLSLDQCPKLDNENEKNEQYLLR